MINERKPFLILISGGTCSGKSTLTELLSNNCKKSNISVSTFSTDDFYKTTKPPIDWDNPSSIHQEILQEKLKKILKREKTYYPKVEKKHKEGVTTELIFHNDVNLKNPSDVVILEGVHALQFEEIRKLAEGNGLKLWINVDEDIRLIRKIKRGPVALRKNERKLTHEEHVKFIFDWFNKWVKWIKNDHTKFIQPTKKYADLIINNNTENQLDQEVEKVINYINLYFQDKNEFRQKLNKMQAKTSEKNESASEVRMPSSNQKEIAKDSQISPLWLIPVVLITVILTGLIMRLFIKKKK